jgi:hypothetical protein
MSTGRKFTGLLMVGLLCVSSLVGETASSQRKSKKKQAPLPPPLPSGPQGPVPQIPLDSIPAVAPQVIYESGQLTILAPNSTLADILRAVRKQTSAEIDIPPNANERVVTSLGPGPAREIVAELLNGSRFNYVLLGSPSDANQLTRVVLVARTSPEVAAAPGHPQEQNPVPGQALVTPPQPAEMVENPEAETADDTATDENADQNAAEAEQQQQQQTPEQPGAIKTPQQMLQEMQQRQLQMQQQQQQLTPGQPPYPGAAIPQRPQPQPQEP